MPKNPEKHQTVSDQFFGQPVSRIVDNKVSKILDRKVSIILITLCMVY